MTSGNTMPRKKHKNVKLHFLQKVAERNKSGTLKNEVLHKHKNLTYLKIYIYALCYNR